MLKGKFEVKSFIIGFIVASLVIASGTVSADPIERQINAVYNNIKIFVDGKQIDPTDANGNPVEPFGYNGTTYLPVRAIAQALGKEVSWDNTTKTVYIGERTTSGTETKYMSDILEPYYGQFDVNKKMIMGGKEYNKGYSFLAMSANRTVSFNLDSNYTQIVGVLGLEDGMNTDNTKIEIFADGNLIKSYILEAGTLPLTISLDVSGVKKLEIKNAESFVTRVDFVDVEIK